MKTDIMSLDIKVGYSEIIKSPKLLNNLTVGQLKGVHYNLHKSYNLKTLRKDIKILIYKAHNLLLKKLEQLDVKHSQLDTLDVQFKRKYVEKKQPVVIKHKVFLLRKSVKRVG